MPEYQTVDDYIAHQAPAVQPRLQQLRSLIKETVNGAEELLNYKVPSFTLRPGGKREQQVMFAAYEKFIGFYPFPTTIEAFATELQDYKYGKGSVQFPHDRPLPEDLIRRMIRYRQNELTR